MLPTATSPGKAHRDTGEKREGEKEKEIKTDKQRETSQKNKIRGKKHQD